MDAPSSNVTLLQLSSDASPTDYIAEECIITDTELHPDDPSYQSPQKQPSQHKNQPRVSPVVPGVSSGSSSSPNPGVLTGLLSSPSAPSTLITPIAPSTVDHGIVPEVHNVVSTVNLACKLDLKKIALNARNAEYNPKRFAAVVMRIREPRTAALIFSSGKMVITGARSEDNSNLAARKYARIVQKLGFEVKFLDFKIQNMVGSCDVKFPIQLEDLYSVHNFFSRYEPELFPGLIYRMLKPRIVLLIFVSGKIVLTGAKDRSELVEAFENIHPILKGFRKRSRLTRDIFRNSCYHIFSQPFFLLIDVPPLLSSP